jgi:hypothetical protein
MRALAEAWPEPEILQSLIAKLPWGHNLRVLDRIKDRPTREWYLGAALEYGWSQDVLVLQIKSRLHEREGKALTNFQRELPPPESDMAEQILISPDKTKSLRGQQFRGYRLVGSVSLKVRVIV